MYTELEDEVKRVFGTLPQIQAATFNGRAIDQRFQIPISMPLEDNYIVQSDSISATEEDTVAIEEKILDDEDTLFPEFQSELSIPFVHQEYDDIIYHLNQGENTHTAVKPYLYNEVRPYIDLEKKRKGILKQKESWGGRKLWNEHLALVKGENFWFTAEPGF